MFTFSRPSDSRLRSVLEQNKDAAFSYAEPGASRHAALPDGYNIDRYRIQLGSGPVTFAAAKTAVQRWEMFDKSWLRVFPENADIRQGTTVAVVVPHFGFWSINLSRIVYAVNSDGPVATFGFAYGTLTEHAERGEERFTISWDRSSDEVCYEILAVSRPRAILARIGYPASRALQRRFGRTSLAAMVKAVCSG